MADDAEPPRPKDRRWLLTRAGAVTAAGIGLLPIACSPATAAAPTPVTAYNVRDYGAVGDGATDDRRAIQAAFDSVTAAGGAIFFPPGDYVVSGPLTPKASSLVFGSHTPGYSPTANPMSACKIRMRSRFAGAGLLVASPDTPAVTIRNLALVGDGVGNGLHGIRMPDTASASGEQGWTLRDVTIAGFTGDGIYGHVSVWKLANMHIHNNLGWGINASAGNSWTDVFVSDSFVYFNRTGGMWFGGPGESGLVQFVNCRFERSGGLPADPATPLNPSAPGIRINSGKSITFANCSTDANMGNGIELIAASAGAVSVLANVYLTNCCFSRDGTGDQATQAEFAGVKVRGFSSATDTDGANQMKFSNCLVGTGQAADTGSGSILGPKYGVWYENTEGFQWIGGGANGETSPFFVGAGNNHLPTVLSLYDGMATLPLGEPHPAADGMTYLDSSANRLMIRVNGTWKGVTLS